MMRWVVAGCLAVQLLLAPPLSSQPTSTVRVVRNVEFGRAGGQSLQLDFYPAAKAGAPLVIYLHGGGWAEGSRAKLGLGAVELLEAGFAVASVDYRLVPQAVWPAQLEDVKCAVRYLRSHAQELGVDGQRFGVWGESAGGHLAALVGLVDASRGWDSSGGSTGVSSAVQAVVDLYGPTDFNAQDMTTSRGEGFVRGFVGESRETRAAASPMNYVSAGAPPFLVVHGNEDPMVPLVQSERLVGKLREAGAAVELVTVARGGHGFSSHPERQALAQRIVDFFRRQLKAE